MRSKIKKNRRITRGNNNETKKKKDDVKCGIYIAKIVSDIRQEK